LTAARVEIRAADLAADRDVLVGLLRQYSTVRSNHERYRWFYEDNPHGPATVFLAIEPESRQIIGSGAVIPRRMTFRDEMPLASVMADFWVHPQYRSLGPALKLQRACMEQAERWGFAFYDLPQGNMPAVYQRMRMLGSATLSRYSKPLRSGPFLAKAFGGSGWVRFPAGGVDWVMRWLDTARAPRSALQIAPHAAAFGPEFDSLAEAASRTRISVARSAAYLEWRYRRHYYLQYSVFTARDKGNLTAYAVTVRSGVYAEVIDLYPADNSSVMVDLLFGVARHERANGCAALAIGWPSENGFEAVLARAGLRERERRALVIHEFPAASGLVAAPHGWYLTYGDIDY
jgi:GNAT superfamily N-acetyltransferase